jgi:hypothetical protein
LGPLASAFGDACLYRPETPAKSGACPSRHGCVLAAAFSRSARNGCVSARISPIARHGPAIATVSLLDGDSQDQCRVHGNNGMEDLKAHPNTEAVLDAWRRLATGDIHGVGATTDDYPDVVGSLFVLNRIEAGDFSFRRVGCSIDRLFGRPLADHNFLSLWSEPGRSLVSAAFASARSDRAPAIVHARGETLDGRRIDLEFALAPLVDMAGPPGRFLGLCQPMTPVAALGGRPLHRLQVVAVYPPSPTIEPAIRIVSSR